MAAKNPVSLISTLYPRTWIIWLLILTLFLIPSVYSKAKFLSKQNDNIQVGAGISVCRNRNFLSTGQAIVYYSRTNTIPGYQASPQILIYCTKNNLLIDNIQCTGIGVNIESDEYLFGDIIISTHYSFIMVSSKNRILVSYRDDDRNFVSFTYADQESILKDKSSILQLEKPRNVDDYVVTLSQSSQVLLWKITEFKTYSLVPFMILHRPSKQEVVSSIAVSNDSKIIALGYLNGGIQIIEYDKGHLTLQKASYKFDESSLFLNVSHLTISKASENQYRIAAAISSGTVQVFLYNLISNSLELIAYIDKHTILPLDLQFSYQGTVLIILTAKQMSTWSIVSKKVQLLYVIYSISANIQIHEEAKYIVLLDQETEVKGSYIMRDCQDYSTNSLKRAVNYERCQCAQSDVWDSAQGRCVAAGMTLEQKCKADQLSTGQIGGDKNSCECIFGNRWCPHENICIIDCRITLKGLYSKDKYSCYCGEKYDWNHMKKECYQSCTGILYALVKSRDQDQKGFDCECTDGRVWNASTELCNLDCSSINHTDGTNYVERCNCQKGYVWEESVRQCVQLQCRRNEYEVKKKGYSECVCKAGYLRNQRANNTCQLDCSQVPQAIKNLSEDTCLCQDNYNFNGTKCVPSCKYGLFVGSAMNSQDKCVCFNGYVFNESLKECKKKIVEPVSQEKKMQANEASSKETGSHNSESRQKLNATYCWLLGLAGVFYLGFVLLILYNRYQEKCKKAKVVPLTQHLQSSYVTKQQ